MTLLIIKTVEAQLAPLRTRVVALHPYTVPEVVTIRLDDASPDYEAWLREQVDRP